jgi:hypothetical protein
MNKPVSIATMIGLPPRSAGIVVAPDAVTPSDDCSRHALRILERLRGGWRPDSCRLADARRMQRWCVVRRNDTACQFIGFAADSRGITSTIVATLLAIDPAAGWALLFPDRWIRLGAPSSAQPPVDPSDIMRRAEAWLRHTS